MENHHHNLASLFSQLGLPTTPQEMDAFIAGHRLHAGQALHSADFWTPVQAQFLAQAVRDDADWADAVDHLAVRLSEPAPQ